MVRSSAGSRFAGASRAGELPVDLDQRITPGRFTALIGKTRKTVTQRRGRPGFPSAGADGKYLARELMGCWNVCTGRHS
jgi:hypothetical protein